MPTSPEGNRRLFRVVICSVCATLLLLVSGLLHGQSPQRAILHLYLETENGRAVERAELRLTRGDLEHVARFDSAGTLRLADLPTGEWTASVRRVGIRELRISLRIEPGYNQYVLIAEEVEAMLPTVLVEEMRVKVARHTEFESRRVRGAPNATITRGEIERRGAIALSQLLRGRAGLRVGDSLGYKVAISTRGAKPTRNTINPGFALVQCVMRVSIDGVILPPLTDLDDIMLNEVFGIEIYFGPARVPPVLAGSRTDNWCGLIAVWTR
ncbi:MAG: hypothetical protein ACK6DP_02915 [Gemmatimonas sp.]|jgi:hypothetical protein|uniref:hypothetical protein n=1 Tax=Gemmatimonas sp. TaxID=1962908 RepID=UPI00391F5518|nr:Plug domain-containing protein [Gemmatimonadota bacterium]